MKNWEKIHVTYTINKRAISQVYKELLNDEEIKKQEKNLEEMVKRYKDNLEKKK